MNFPQGYRNKKAKLKDGAKNRQIYLINRTIPIYLTEQLVYIPRNFTNEWQSLYLRSKRKRPLENTVPQLLKLYRTEGVVVKSWKRSLNSTVKLSSWVRTANVAAKSAVYSFSINKKISLWWSERDTNVLSKHVPHYGTLWFTIRLSDGRTGSRHQYIYNEHVYYL